MSSQIERGTAREMVHTIAFRAGVLEPILQEPVLGSLEIRVDELAYVKLLQRQIDDLCRYLNLPSAEPEQKWIPVSEALPEDMDRVLVTIRRRDKKIRVRSGDYYKGYFMMDNGDTWNETDKEVIAWMPLPKPWRGDR